MNDVFKAGVQYDDFIGTAAADRADGVSFADYLREIGLAEEGEQVVGVRMGFYGNHGAEMERPDVVAYLLKADQFIEKPKRVRAVEVDIPIAKLFSFFKRFDLVLSNKSMDFGEVEVDGPHYH